jgi:predicted transporter
MSTDGLSWLPAVCFSSGAFSLPLLLLGLLSREAFVRWRGRLLTVGSAGKMGLGAVLVATGVFILKRYGQDRSDGLVGHPAAMDAGTLGPY